MAAVAVAMELEVPPEAIREALAAFSGVDRRFQVRGRERGITVIDDYGHHPTEIRATLESARLCGFRRIHVLFQPHRFTRTFHLMEEFAGAFHQADSVFVMDIYAASEKPIAGITAEALVERIRQFGHRGAEYVGTMDRGVEALLSVAGEGDAVLTLGAGSVWQAGEKAAGAAAERGQGTDMAREAKKIGAWVQLAAVGGGCGAWRGRRLHRRGGVQSAPVRPHGPAVHALAATARMRSRSKG